MVNDELVTFKDLKDYIHDTYVQLSAEGMPESKIRPIMIDLEKNGVNKLVEDKLMLSKANQIGLQVNDQVIDDRIAQIMAKYPSEDAFINGLVSHGATVTDLRNKILNQFKIKYVIEHEVKSKVFVNPQEVTDYYTSNMNDFKKSERCIFNELV